MNSIFSICFVLAVAASAVFGQEVAVNVKISGIDFSLRFDPAVTPAAAMGRRFCIEHGGRLGVTAETLDNCVVPVTNYLQREVENAIAKQATKPAQPQSTTGKTAASAEELTPVQTKFKIGEVDYSLTFYPTLTTAERVAEQFCRQKGGEFGVTDGTLPACINTISKHVASVVAQGNAAAPADVASSLPVEKEYRSITVDLTIEDQEFHLKFQPEITRTSDVASQLCTQRGASFGVTNDNLPYCIKTITDYLDAEVRAKL